MLIYKKMHFVYFLIVAQLQKKRQSSAFRQLPHELILLETDAPDMSPPAALTTHPLAENLNHPANLPAIGHALAKALQLSPEHLADLTRANTVDCFTLP